MALLINDDCVNCGVCEPECPNTAITEGDDYYEIATDSCTECIGHFDEPQCIDVCPVECIVKDPKNEESEEQLKAKFEKLTA